MILAGKPPKSTRMPCSDFSPWKSSSVTSRVCRALRSSSAQIWITSTCAITCLMTCATRYLCKPGGRNWLLCSERVPKAAHKSVIYTPLWCCPLYQPLARCVL